MIDLHLHILPDIDDGPSTLAETEAMLDWLAEAGYRRLVATPHLMEPLDAIYGNRVESACEVVATLAEARGITFGYGYEHMVAPDLPQRIAAGERSTLDGSRAMLIEFPFLGWNYAADRTLFELQLLGYRPVLAHPERYAEALAHPELIFALVERGIVPQITLAAIAGTYGGQVRDFARELLRWSLKADLPFVLATDAHSPGHRLTDSIAGRAWIERHIPNGEAIVTWAGDIVPTALLEDEPLPSFESWSGVGSIPQQQSSRWGGLRGVLTRIRP